jgi:hypothetical protein
MRTKIMITATLAALILAPWDAAGQAPGDTVTLTGCLAQEEGEADAGFILQGVDSEITEATRIELSADEEVDLAPHVGHTVEISGVAVAAPAEEIDPEMPEAPEENALHIQVAALQHVEASCEEPTSDGLR